MAEAEAWPSPALVCVIYYYFLSTFLLCSRCSLSYKYFYCLFHLAFCLFSARVLPPSHCVEKVAGFQWGFRGLSVVGGGGGRHSCTWEITHVLQCFQHVCMRLPCICICIYSICSRIRICICVWQSYLWLFVCPLISFYLFVCLFWPGSLCVLLAARFMFCQTEFVSQHWNIPSPHPTHSHCILRLRMRIRTTNWWPEIFAAVADFPLSQAKFNLPPGPRLEAGGNACVIISTCFEGHFGIITFPTHKTKGLHNAPLGTELSTLLAA